MRGIGIRLLIIAVIAGGAFVLRDRLSGSASDLAVGDCFDDTPGATVESVQHHPCNEGHTAEVFYVGDYPGGDDAALPTDDDLVSFSDNTCFGALVSYLGGTSAIETNPLIQKIDFGLFYPTAEGWNGGDRKVICYLYTTDGSPLTQTMRASTQ